LNGPLIFDFDGVVADSEELANTLLAEAVSALGRPTTTDDSIRLFMGKRWVDCMREIEAWTGAPLPADFEEHHKAIARPRMRSEVGPVAGVAAFLAATEGRTRAIASSSGHDWLNHCVDTFGFRPHFGTRVFSAQDVANGKPAPDIFLHAAAGIGAAPRDCVVIEDSPSGVIGARAAGMRVIGFLGASHIRDGHRERLLAAGAEQVAVSFTDVARMIGLELD
jgi:HAD superfamily hydrolase (TIGR01509 family)